MPNIRRAEKIRAELGRHIARYRQRGEDMPRKVLYRAARRAGLRLCELGAQGTGRSRDEQCQEDTTGQPARGGRENGEIAAGSSTPRNDERDGNRQSGTSLPE